MAAISDMTVQSGFVFEGKVEQLQASTARGFPATSETVVVRVTSIFKSPPALANYVGQAITVQLKAPVDLSAGDEAVFFTHGVHYGESLVVAEIGRAPAGDPTMEAQVQSTMEAGQSNELTQRLAQAELVISGVASEPTSFVPAVPPPISEHDPDWGTATISVDTVEKGDHSEPTQDVLFARSIDIAWYDAPKVKAGDRGVWLLQRRDTRGKPVPALAIVHPLDFQPASELENVRALLKNTQ